MSVLSAFHRQQNLTLFRDDVTPEQLAEACRVISADLHKAIGGRYIPKQDGSERKRRERDLAVMAAFNGRNRPEVMRQFGISRALFYNIVARMRAQKVKAI